MCSSDLSGVVFLCLCLVLCFSVCVSITKQVCLLVYFRVLMCHSPVIPVTMVLLEADTTGLRAGLIPDWSWPDSCGFFLAGMSVGTKRVCVCMCVCVCVCVCNGERDSVSSV